MARVSTTMGEHGAGSRRWPRPGRPAAGYTGADSFQYTIAGSNAPSLTATATVSITVGTLVWYVNDSLGAAGNGEAGTPFNTLAAANSAAE